MGAKGFQLIKLMATDTGFEAETVGTWQTKGEAITHLCRVIHDKYENDKNADILQMQADMSTAFKRNEAWRENEKTLWNCNPVEVL